MAAIKDRQRELPSVEVQDVPSASLDAYREIIDLEVAEEIERLAAPLKGARVVLLNATAFGGGVAEMFPAFMTMLRDLGLEVEWRIIPPEDAFFAVTKNLHNSLQGQGRPLTEADKQTYLRHNAFTASLLARCEADIYEIHDPQPAAVHEAIAGTPALWRCHIDTSRPDPAVWQFLRPFIERYDRQVFSMSEFVPSDLDRSRVEIVRPAIHAFSLKNTPLDMEGARKLLASVGIDARRPVMTQISRFDPWKDPKGVVEAYRLAKYEVPGLQLALVGSMASDDPEGPQILAEMRDYVGSDPDVHLVVATGPNDLQVNAFQTASDVIVQKSIREGFGLTVTEAMWKGQPVIGGKAGGIVAQIEDGISGLLVGSVEECAQAVLRLLSNPEERRSFGVSARENVRRKFLIPHLVRDHLALYSHLLGEKSGAQA